MPKGTFKPIVMFFGLTNSTAMFQAIMNDLLRDMIEMGKVAVFIDNVMIATETEEGHDEIIEKVLRKIVMATTRPMSNRSTINKSHKRDI